ncbi:cation:proton antiporter [Agrococcus sp. Ld7]|uniref:cation:proton antiporter domain-containing protein n=1 Tax=Agrococcus sp. Ld7 TaxID=649148 RepID=UPI00386D11C1
MGIAVTYLALIFGCGLLARLLKLPALIGFLGAGFALNALGVEQVDALSVLADIGVTLMLFAIGLRLDLRSLLGKHVWVTAGAHMVLLTVIGTAFLAGMSALGAFGPEPLHVLATLALVLSFSSTIFVVKMLQERGDEQALYGSICIGVLIMQDIVAVVVISISRGQAPSLFSLGLLIVIPALYWATRHWYRLGHGDMGALFGIAMALIPGYALFEWLGLSGSLGALVMGLILAPHPGADQLSHTLFTVKELLLVGFFVTIGFQGLPTWHNVGVGMLLLLLLPLHALAYWGLLWLLGMRNRTSVLSALLLSNYSEFALIIAAMGVSAGWLAPHWLLSLSIAVSAGFIVSALVNPRSVSLASRFAQRLPARPPHKIHPDDRPIELGDATAIVLGMGRVGLATYRQLTEAHQYTVLGVEHDPTRVHHLRERGVNVVEGDATDYDFWARLIGSGTVRIVVLAMPAQHANIDALRELRSFGYGQVTVAAVASYQEDVEELESLGLDAVIRLYEGAGETLADRSVAAARELP